MNQHLAIFKELYRSIDEFIFLKPWEYVYGEDIIQIDFEDRDSVYCSIMGKNGDCIGLVVYEGEEGFKDYCSIHLDYEDPAIIQYLMFEQTCLTFYLGERNEVPKEQLDILYQLKIKYDNKQMPYFLSFKKQYYPAHLSDEQALFMTQVLNRLIDIMRQYIDSQIDVQFESDEIIHAYQDKGDWIYEAMALPPFDDKFLPVIFDDDETIEKLKQQEKTSNEIIVDLNYMNMEVDDPQFDRPCNSLLLMIYDVNRKMILRGDMVHPENDEIEEVFRMFGSYILEYGRPKTIYVRNPTVFSALCILCDECDIEMKPGDFSVIDEIIEDMVYKMYD